MCLSALVLFTLLIIGHYKVKWKIVLILVIEHEKRQTYVSQTCLTIPLSPMRGFATPVVLNFSSRQHSKYGYEWLNSKITTFNWLILIVILIKILSLNGSLTIVWRWFKSKSTTFQLMMSFPTCGNLTEVTNWKKVIYQILHTIIY